MYSISICNIPYLNTHIHQLHCEVMTDGSCYGDYDYNFYFHLFFPFDAFNHLWMNKDVMRVYVSVTHKWLLISNSNACVYVYCIIYLRSFSITWSGNQWINENGNEASGEEMLTNHNPYPYESVNKFIMNKRYACYFEFHGVSDIFARDNLLPSSKPCSWQITTLKFKTSHLSFV